MNEAKNKDFFSKLWKCPLRRVWRYGRKLLLAFIWGIVIWVSLDFMAILLVQPQQYPPLLSLLTHALLTISLSLALTVATHQLHLRLSSRFRLIQAFQSSRRPADD